MIIVDNITHNYRSPYALNTQHINIHMNTYLTNDSDHVDGIGSKT